jgi:hypothetical protein
VTKELSAISVNWTITKGSKSDITEITAKLRENCKFTGTRVQTKQASDVTVFTAKFRKNGNYYIPLVNHTKCVSLFYLEHTAYDIKMLFEG